MRATQIALAALLMGCGAAPVAPKAPVGNVESAAKPPVKAPPTDTVYPITDGALDCRGGQPRTEKLSPGSAGWCERDGVKHGPYVRRHENGKVAYQVFMIRGLREGKVESFFDNGERKSSGQFKKGQKTGTWTYWNLVGDRWTGPMLGDARHGAWTFTDKSGVVRQAGAYTHGVRHGEWTFKTADGTPGRGHYNKGQFGPCEGKCFMFRTSAEVQEAVIAQRPLARKCYAPAERKGLKGNVVVEWTIASNGSGDNASVQESTLKHASVERCLTKLSESMQLPVPPDEVPWTSRREFTFSPQKALIDSLSTSGHCRTKQLRATINPSRAALGDCLRRLANGSDSLEIRWTLADDGALKDHPTTTPDNAALRACVHQQSHGWRFGALGGTCSVKYTIRRPQ